MALSESIHGRYNGLRKFTRSIACLRMQRGMTAMEQDAAAATEALGQSETSVTPETAETSEIDLAFAALGAELKGLLGLPVEKRANTEPHEHDAERQRADLTERNVQLAAELAAVRATAEKAIAEYASVAERLAAIAEARRPWWRRLVG